MGWTSRAALRCLVADWVAMWEKASMVRGPRLQPVNHQSPDFQGLRMSTCVHLDCGGRGSRGRPLSGWWWAV